MFGVKWQCRLCGMVWNQNLVRNLCGIPTCGNGSCVGTCDPIMEFPNLVTTVATGQTPVFVNLGSFGLGSPVEAEPEEALVINKPCKIRW